MTVSTTSPGIAPTSIPPLMAERGHHNYSPAVSPLAVLEHAAKVNDFLADPAKPLRVAVHEYVTGTEPGGKLVNDVLDCEGVAVLGILFPMRGEPKTDHDKARAFEAAVDQVIRCPVMTGASGLPAGFEDRDDDGQG